MVQALAPNRTNHPFDIGSLPGGSRPAQNLMDSHVGYCPAEFIPEHGRFAMPCRTCPLTSLQPRYTSPQQQNRVTRRSYEAHDDSGPVGVVPFVRIGCLGTRDVVPNRSSVVKGF